MGSCARFRCAQLTRTFFSLSHRRYDLRYYAYSEASIVEEVLSGYKNFSIPLNVLVFDME